MSNSIILSDCKRKGHLEKKRYTFVSLFETLPHFWQWIGKDGCVFVNKNGLRKHAKSTMK